MLLARVGRCPRCGGSRVRVEELEGTETRCQSCNRVEISASAQAETAAYLDRMARLTASHSRVTANHARRTS